MTHHHTESSAEALRLIRQRWASSSPKHREKRLSWYLLCGAHPQRGWEHWGTCHTRDEALAVGRDWIEKRSDIEAWAVVGPHGVTWIPLAASVAPNEPAASRLTPERLAEIRAEFARLLPSASSEHYALAGRTRMGRELLAEIDALQAELDRLHKAADYLRANADCLGVIDVTLQLLDGHDPRPNEAP